MYPGREIPQSFATLSAGDRHLAGQLHQLEHLGDVLVIRPAGRLPGQPRRCPAEPATAAGRRRRAGGGCRAAPSRWPTARPSPRPNPDGRLGSGSASVHLAAVERDVLGRPDQGAELDQGVIRKGPLQLARAGTSARAGSTAQGPRSAPRLPPGPAGTASAAERPRADRSVAAGPAAAPRPRSAVPAVWSAGVPPPSDRRYGVRAPGSAGVGVTIPSPRTPSPPSTAADPGASPVPPRPGPGQ